MNNNTFNTITTINDDYILYPYNDHYSSQPVLLPFISPNSSSINDFLIHSSSNSNTSNNHFDHHQFLQPSPFSQFEFPPDFVSFLPQNNGHDDNQTIPNGNNYPSLPLPLNNTIGDQQPLEPSETITHIEDSHRISTPQNVKKPRRTDRHSKIKTAKGTRDRRVRLSLEVARELFGLQDMLGFDKASKTVEWLLIQAKPEILKIAKTLPHHFGFSSGDESQNRSALGSMDTSSDKCELASLWTVDDRSNNIDTTETKGNKDDGRSKRGKRERLSILKKMSKEARAKARERAKDRTKEKMMKRISQVKIVEEEEAQNRYKIIHNGKTGVNWSSIETVPCENDLLEFVMSRKYQTSDEFNDIINKTSSSLSTHNYHRSQGTATS